MIDLLFMYLKDMLPVGNAPSSHLSCRTFQQAGHCLLRGSQTERLWSYDERHWQSSV